MKIKMLLLIVVAAATLSATGFGQGQQKLALTAEVSPDATSTCKATFTSGTSPNYLQFCVTVNGNIVEFKSPQPYEHIREGTVLEGYSICDFGTLNSYFDFASAASSNWLPPTFSGTSLPLTIKRTTSDGIYTLTQVITRNTVDPTVLITMTLKNNTAASHDFSLVRYADVDANNANGGNFHNWFDFDHQSAWGYNPGFNLFGLMLSTAPTAQAHFAFVQNTSGIPDSCNPVNNLPTATPWFGDGSVAMDWNGTLGPGKSVTVIAEYKRF